MSLATHHNASKHSLLSMIVLVLTLVQGTSTTLTLVYHYSPPLEPLISMLWASTYMLALIGLIANFGINWITWLIRYRLLLSVLLIGTAFSAVWSYDLGLTVERTVHLFGSTLIAFYIGFTIPLTRIVNATALVLGLLMLCSVGAALGMPALGIENYEGRNVWRGIMTSKNTLGFWSAITILACAVAFGNTQTVGKKLLLSAGFILGVIALVNSVSATSLLSLIVSVLVMAYLYVAFRFDLGLISTLVLGVFAAGLVGLAFYNIDTAELIGRSGDLTGRGDVWNQVWQLIMDKPLTGYGYGTIWYPTEESVWIQQALTDFSWKVFHAHNGLLQLASEIGIPLTFIAVIMIIQQLIEIVYCQYQRQQAGVLFVLGFTVALLVSNYSEARLVVNRELYWIFFVALPISMLQQVHVIAAGAKFNPMPAPLHKRTRGKIQSNASDREYRRKLKRRLNDRLQLHDGGKQQPDNIVSTQAKLAKPNDQQKKTGS
jgi:O-antigen ligase